MNIFSQYGARQLLLVSMVGAIFVICPNIACLAWELSFMDGEAREVHLWFFAFRYVFFAILIWLLVKINIHDKIDWTLKRRCGYNFMITTAAYALYVGITSFYSMKADCFTGILLFQFFVTCVVCAFAGHISLMYAVQRRKEQEIEQLKIENLQSRYNALSNQINPHFFFNSLNCLTALVRKNDVWATLGYIDKMSDVFRYILQSDSKGLVTLGDELKFIDAFKYMMETRFTGKLTFTVEVAESEKSLQIPVLSLLPLIDNVVVHNMIDSKHKMEVVIKLNEASELVVTSLLFPKIDPPETNGTGLRNLENRFALLTGRNIRTECDKSFFTVYLPLK